MFSIDNRFFIRKHFYHSNINFKIFLIFFLFISFSLIYSKNTLAAESKWTYKKFPMIKRNKKINLPVVIKLGSETLHIRMTPTSSTHPILGVDQIYLSKNRSKRIFFKQNVEISNHKILGHWIKLRQGHVFHFESQKQVHAVYALGYNDHTLNLIEKNFRSLKQRKYSFNFLKTNQTIYLVSQLLNVSCAQTQSEIVGSVQNQTTAPSSSNLGQNLTLCLVNKTGSE